MSAAIAASKKRLYYIIYGLSFFFIGAQYGAPPALYAKVRKQLDINTQEMSTIYSVGEIAIGVAALITGYVVDTGCKNYSHLFLAALGVLSAFGYFGMVYIEHYYLMLLDWIIVNCVLGAIECAVVVYLYRISSSHNSSSIITANFLLMGIGSTVTAQFIAISITYFPDHTYSTPLNFMAVIAIIFSLGVTVLRTPKDVDQTKQISLNRSNTIINGFNKESKSQLLDSMDLNASMEGIAHAEELSININNIQSIATKQNNDHNHKRSDVIFFRIMVGLLIGLYAGQKDTYLSLGVTYAEHIGINEEISMYLITAFWTGKMISQFILIWVVKKYEPDRIILYCSILMVLNAFLFILIELSDDKWNVTIFDGHDTLIIILMMIIYATAAFVSIPVYVISFAFIKQIENMSAFLSALVLVAYTVGCGLFSFIAGVLYQNIGPWIYPFFIFGIVTTSLSLWCYTNMKYNKYKVTN